MKDGIIIQARTGSSRLRNKILLPFWEDLSIIDIIISNVKKSCPDKTIILATTNKNSDDILEQVAKDAGIFCFRGDEDNVLDRFITAAETYDLDRFIRVCSDNPFLLTDSFNVLFDAHNKMGGDYVAYGFANGCPTIKSHLGLFAELTTTKALQKVASLTQDKLNIEHVTIFLYSNLHLFDVNLLPLPKELEGRHDLRFTLDTSDDFKLLQQLYVLYDKKKKKSIQTLLQLVDEFPSCKDLMRENISKNEK